MKQVRQIYDRIFKQNAVQLGYGRTRSGIGQSPIQIHPTASKLFN